MSCHAGPDIVENGLVFCYDMNNTQKSWKGKPTTNFLLVPNAYNNGTYWNTTSYPTPVSSNVILAPDNTLSGSLITGNGSSGSLFIQGVSTSITGTGKLIASVCAKHHSAPYFTLNCYYNEDGEVNIPFYLESGTCGAGGTIIPLGNDWYRCSHEIPARVNSGTLALYRIWPSGRGVVNTTGCYFCNSQLEAGNFVTPFIDGTRSNVQAIIDLTGNNTITATNLSYNSDGTFSFDGTDDYLSLPSLNLQQNFTLECWAYITGDGSGLFGQGVYGTGQGLHILWNAQGNRGMIFGMYANDLDSPSYTLTYNTWHHYVFTYNHSTYLKQFYVDGSLFNSGSGTAYSGTGQFNIGAIYSSASAPAKGKIASVKFYNRVLSAAEIAQNFNATRRIYGI